MIHLESIRDDIDIARWYDGDGEEGFEKHLPYKAVATLIWYDTVVEICALHGVMTKVMRNALAERLIERGATKAFATRRGRLVEWAHP